MLRLSTCYSNEYSVSTNSKTYDMHDKKLEYQMNTGVLLNFEGTLAGRTLDGTSTAVFPGPVTSWNETAGLGDGNIFKYDGLFFLSLTLAKPTEDGGLWKVYGWVSPVGSTEGLDRAAGALLVVSEGLGSSKP